MTPAEARAVIQAHIERARKAPTDEQDLALAKLFFTDNAEWVEITKSRASLHAAILAWEALVKQKCAGWVDYVDGSWSKCILIEPCPTCTTLIAVAQSLEAGGKHA